MIVKKNMKKMKRQQKQRQRQHQQQLQQLSIPMTVLISMLLLGGTSRTVSNAFTISPVYTSKSRSTRGVLVPTRELPSATSTSTSKTTTTTTSPPKSPTQLNYGILVPVPDDFFTIAGISLGFAYTITRSWNRVVVENVAWEKRLEDARMQKLDEGDYENDDGSGTSSRNTYTELDLRKMDAEASQSSYGPEAMERRRRRRNRVRTLDFDEDEYDDDYDDDDEYDQKRNKRQSSSNSMTDEQINDFEETYGVAYDPYYDDPYTEDELPDDMSFVEDKVYGDRRYQNGEIFYRDENDKNLYWRQGGRPRLKQFWELF